MLTESYFLRLKKLAGIVEAQMKFDEYILSENHKYEFGALMLEVEYENWKDIINEIPKKDLYNEPGFGYETEPHVTILFGFHKGTDIDKVKEMIKENCDGPIEITLKAISFFDNKEKGYDVVKFDVGGQKLHQLNKLMTDNFKFTSDFPDYHPHMTIAYVKPGKGKVYSKSSKNIKVKCNKFIFSSPDKKKTYFTI